MAKGLRMEAAFDPAQNAVRKAEHVGSEETGFLCEHCRVPVEHVSGYVVNGHDQRLRREVPSFFKLPSKGGAGHQPGCEHTPLGLVKALVHASEAVEDALNPFAESEADGSYIFRINIAAHEVAQQGEPGEGKPSREEYRERIERVWSGERIAPYCRSAVGLARLWAIMEGAEGHRDLRQAVTIQDRGTVIKWEDFFFSMRRYSRLANRLQKGSIQHPVAALIEVRQLGNDRGGAFLDCVAMPEAGGEVETRIAPKIYIPEKYAGAFQAHGRYIVFGNWRYFEPEQPWVSPDGKKTIRYRNIILRILNKAQFAAVQLPGEGEENGG